MPATVEAYLAGLSEAQRTGVETIRAAVRAGAPEATGSIAYGMPALRVDGHCLFPASDGVVQELGHEVAPHVAGKGTLRFRADRPIPADLITRIVRIRLDEEAAARATTKADSSA